MYFITGGLRALQAFSLEPRPILTEDELVTIQTNGPKGGIHIPEVYSQKAYTPATHVLTMM